MAPLSLYNISVPVLIRYLKNLSAILKKGEQHADENGIPHDTILNTTLAPDMKALAFQIQRASDSAKGITPRIAGMELVSMEDTETTFDQLQARVQKTIDVLNTVEPAAMDGKEDAEVVIATPQHEFRFTGQTYLMNFALPNFLFHVTTAYAILRHAGVPVGKMDYLGSS